MKRPHRNRPGPIPLQKPIGSASQISGFGCILARVHGDIRVSGRNLIFMLDGPPRQGAVQLAVQLGHVRVGPDAGHVSGFRVRAVDEHALMAEGPAWGSPSIWESVAKLQEKQERA
jgi:hypothetical protein